MKTIQLPAPKTLGTLSLEEALKARRTNRECTNAALDDAELAALLWACAGLTTEDGRRTTPSAAGRRLRPSTSVRFRPTFCAPTAPGAGMPRRTRSNRRLRKTSARFPPPTSSNTSKRLP